jgi:hypothetical protein
VKLNTKEISSSSLGSQCNLSCFSSTASVEVRLLISIEKGLLEPRLYAPTGTTMNVAPMHKEWSTLSYHEH